MEESLKGRERLGEFDKLMETVADIAEKLDASETKDSLAGLADLRKSGWPMVEEPVEKEPPRKLVTLEKPPDWEETKVETTTSAAAAPAKKPAQNNANSAPAQSNSGELTADELR